MSQTNFEGQVPDAPLVSEKRQHARGMGNLRGALISASIVSTQFVQMIPYGAGINSSLTIGAELGVSPVTATWLAAAYPLTQGAFIIMGGRVGAVYGHKNAVAIAGMWWVIFHLASGFVRNLIALCTVRALCGIGGAFMVPNAIALLTLTFPPGRMRNISVGFFGAMAPIGAAGGSILPGFFTQLLPWKWLFFFLAMLGAVVFTISMFVVPGEPEPLDKGGRIDYVGAYLGVAGLILFSFVWNQAPSVGWDQSYVYILLIVSISHLIAFAFWEAWVAKEPILPFDIWTTPSFSIMILAAFLTFMGVGIVIWYITVWEQQIRHYTLLSTGATYAPLAVGGAVAALLSAKAVRILPAQYIMAIGSLASCVSLILVSVMPAQQIYWAQIFPALAILALGPDFLFTAAQIIASNSVKRSQQGVAGSLVGTVLSYGLSTGLGFAGTVEVYTNDHGKDPVRGYRNAMYLGIGMTGCAIVLALAFVRIPKDRREGWGEGDSGATARAETVIEAP